MLLSLIYQSNSHSIYTLFHSEYVLVFFLENMLFPAYVAKFYKSGLWKHSGVIAVIYYGGIISNSKWQDRIDS